MFGHIFFNYKLIMLKIAILSHLSSHELINFSIVNVLTNYLEY